MSANPKGPDFLKPPPNLPRRRRSARAVANDDVIREAAVGLVAERGCDALGFSQVATAAGLTVGAVYGRYETRADLGIDLWTERLLPALETALSPTLAAVAAGDAAAAERLVRVWLRPAVELVAALELLIAAQFDSDLYEQIQPDAVRFLQSALDGRGRQAIHHRQLAAELIGWAMMAAYGSGSRPTIKSAVDTLLKTERSRSLAAGRPVELEWRLHPGTGDVHTDTLEFTVLDVIGRVGYGRATLARICRQAGITSGSVFVRYESKHDLVASAVQHLLDDVRASLNQHGHVGLAPAFLHEGRSHLRGLLLEVMRMSAHEPAFADLRLANQGEAWLCGLALIEAYTAGV